MYQLLGKTAIVCAVPKIIDALSDWFTGKPAKFTGKSSEPESAIPIAQTKLPAPLVSLRKKRDSTRWTQVHYDYVIFMFGVWTDWNFNNPKDKKTRNQLVDFLNARMGLHKSKTAYSRIFNGMVDRNALAKGKVYFDNKTF